jgi:hypothetical protein
MARFDENLSSMCPPTGYLLAFLIFRQSIHCPKLHNAILFVHMSKYQNHTLLAISQFRLIRALSGRRSRIIRGRQEHGQLTSEISPPFPQAGANRNKANNWNKYGILDLQQNVGIFGMCSPQKLWPIADRKLRDPLTFSLSRCDFRQRISLCIWASKFDRFHRYLSLHDCLAAISQFVTLAASEFSRLLLREIVHGYIPRMNR